MKITGTRSYILVEFDHRTVKISGELTLDPAFYADRDSITKWEFPYDSEEITAEEKEAIIKGVSEQNNPGFRILFD